MRVGKFFLGMVAASMVASSLSAVELSYHFEEGESFLYQVENKAEPPTQGAILSNLEYAFTGSAGDPAHLQVSIDGSSNKFDIQGAEASFDLGAQGAASNLQSDQINQPVDGAFVKNAPGFFFPLPAGDVQPGQSWQAINVFYFPPLDLPGSFTKLRTRTTFRYEGAIEGDDGRVLHVLKMNSVEAPGSKQKVTLNGTAHFDAEAGRMVSSSFAGVVKVKVGFFWVSVPTTLTLVESAGAPSL